jgi:hypothetical protein
LDPEPTFLLILFTESINYWLLSSIIVLFLLLILSALISGAEVAFFSLTKEDITKASESKSTILKTVVELLENPQKLLHGNYTLVTYSQNNEVLCKQQFQIPDSIKEINDYEFKINCPIHQLIFKYKLKYNNNMLMIKNINLCDINKNTQLYEYFCKEEKKITNHKQNPIIANTLDNIENKTDITKAIYL